MKTFGLIGYPLGHSFSGRYFADKFQRDGISECEYHNFAIDNINRLPSLLAETPGLVGFNVTIPYKEQIISYLDELDAQARTIGAVNCVKIENGRLVGHNTDAYGFENSLTKLIGGQRPKALVLGTGGASKAVRYVLGKLGIEYMMISRTKTDEYLDYGSVNESIIAEYRLLVNTTPLGMFPNVDSAPCLPYESLTDSHFLFDLVYNPSVTKFLQYGVAKGAHTTNGAQMLIDQAERSWKIWNQ